MQSNNMSPAQNLTHNAYFEEVNRMYTSRHAIDEA